MADASTVPTSRSSVGTDSSVARAAETGVMGGPAACLAACRLHAWSASRQKPDIKIGIKRFRTGTMINSRWRIPKLCDAGGSEKKRLYIRDVRLFFEFYQMNPGTARRRHCS